MEYDATRNFFDQFKELHDKVPALALVNDDGIGSVNCEYTHDFAFSKDCYMVILGWKLENCMYDYYVINGKDIVDSLNSMGDCNFIYDTVYTEKCHRCRNVYYSVALIDCMFCWDCRDCQDCFMCVGLRHKRYCIKNVQYTKEEYEKIVASYRIDTWDGSERARAEFMSFALKYPRKFSNLRNCLDCTGDALINGKNSQACFNVQRPENDRWVENADSPKDSYDLSVGGELQECYEGVTPDHSTRSFFSVFSWKNYDVAYVDACHSSRNLFGCCGVRNGEYCILNTQYSKEEYMRLRAAIIADLDRMPYRDRAGNQYRYGEFFPIELSPFHYNETMAQEELPLVREDAHARGWLWQDTMQITMGKETLAMDAIPQAISDIEDSILNEVLACKECGRNYRIVSQELQFYRFMKVPVPRKCFFCRTKERFILRNPYELRESGCGCAGTSSANGAYHNTMAHFHGDGACPKIFKTSWPSEYPGIVYCEQCYNTEIT